MLLVPFALGLAIALALGGRVSRLADIKTGPLLVVIGGMALEACASLAIDRALIGNLAYRIILMIGGAVVIVGFARLWRLPGVVVAIAGLLLNLVVMVANGGTMTVSPGLVAEMGFPSASPSGELRVSGAKAVVRPANETALVWLTDIIPIHIGSYGKVLSLGDVVFVLGLGLTVTFACLGEDRYKFLAEAGGAGFS